MKLDASLFYSLFDGFMDGVLIINHDQVLTYANMTAVNLLKLGSVRKILGKNLPEALPLLAKLDWSKCSEQIFFEELLFEDDTLLVGIKVVPQSTDKMIYLRDMSSEVNLHEKFKTEKLARQKALELSEIDQLTGGLNRAGFLTRFRTAWNHAKQKIESRFALAVIDIDFFKGINDQFGHPAGDKYLQEFSTCIKACLRDCDFLARLGGDEFVVLLLGCDRNQSTEVCLRILDAISKLKVMWDGKALQTTCSIGVCQYEDKLKSTEEMQKLADQAAYISKNSGRNAVCVYPDKSVDRVNAQFQN